MLTRRCLLAAAYPAALPTEDLPRIRVRQCASPSAAPAGSWGDGCGSGMAAERQRQRQRSVTPVDLPCQPGAGSCECGPITPAAAPSHATMSPSAAAQAGAASGHPAAGAPGASAAAAAAAVDDGGQAAAQHAATAAAALWRRIHSFMHCVAGSPLIQSALLSVELGGTHPVAAEPGMPASEALQWTLAQLLGMHLKAGHAEGEPPAAGHAAAAC